MIRFALTIFCLGLLNPSLSAQKTLDSAPQRGGDDQLVYPHLFVHDIGGGESSWQTFAAYMEPAVQASVTLGFCLNADPNSTELYDDVSDELLWPGLPPVADVYVVTFNCDPEGVCDQEGMVEVQSNEAAMLKQALGIKKAIDKILNATGKDKVVLVGHGAGGLAIREYHQNPDLWTGTESPVAKLVTIGTPHMGTNYEPQNGIMSEGDMLATNSEAMRDLRNSYDSAGTFLSQGAYLWGSSNETQEELYSEFNGPWVNVDINCNGDTGDLISWTGGGAFQALNNRPLHLTTDYSSVHDESNAFANSDNLQFSLGAENSDAWTSGGCDFCAFLEENGYDVSACETFTSSGSDSYTGGHASLPEETIAILRAIDEPDCFQEAYEVSFYQNYAGFITDQGEGALYGLDYDDYKITLDEPAIVHVNLSYVATNTTIACRIVDSNADGSCAYAGILAEDNDVNIGSVVSAYLPAGTHFVEFDCAFNYSFTNPFEQYWFYLTQEEVVLGCQDPLSCTYDENANWSDESLCAYPFEPCDDGEDLTINDTYNAFCVCVGEDISGNHELSHIQISAYPNPAQDVIHFDSNQDLSGATAEIFDAQGKIVMSAALDETAKLNVKELPSGVYSIGLTLQEELLKTVRVVIRD